MCCNLQPKDFHLLAHIWLFRPSTLSTKTKPKYVVRATCACLVPLGAVLEQPNSGRGMLTYKCVMFCILYLIRLSLFGFVWCGHSACVMNPTWFVEIVLCGHVRLRDALQQTKMRCKNDCQNVIVSFIHSRYIVTGKSVKILGHYNT